MTSIVYGHEALSSEPLDGIESGSKQVFSQPIPYKAETLARLRESGQWSAYLLWPVLSRCRQTVESQLSGCELNLNVRSITESLLDPMAIQLESWGDGLLALLIAIQKYESTKAPENDVNASFQHFMERFESPEQLLETLSDYPVIIKQANRFFEQFRRNLTELVQRLNEDYSSLVTAFNGSQQDTLIAIDLGSGDSHQGGRTVSILKFDSGLQIVYKPRPVAIYREFQRFVLWLKCRQPLNQSRLSLKVPVAVVREGYGWIEFIAQEPCMTESQVTDFYTRQGMHLALLTIMGANDFHNENIIAHGENPVLIDLETLLTPKMPPFTEVTASAQEMYERSVLFNGMLPFYVPLHRGESIERGGLSGRGGEPTGASLTWQDKGTMSMALREAMTYSVEAKNLPYYCGRVQLACQFVEPILRGFRAAYEALMENREAILNESVAFEGLKQSTIRVVMHNTDMYEGILAGANHPQLLRDDSLRKQHFLQLEQAPHPPSLKQACLQAEVEDMCNGDVPLFYTRVDSRDLYHNGQKIVTGALSLSAWEKFERRIRALSATDLDQQLWLIESTFQLHLARETRATPLNCDVPSPKLDIKAGRNHLDCDSSTGVSPEVNRVISTLLAQADTLKHEPSPDEQLWYGVRSFKAFTEVAPLDFDLYTGQTGIVICLAYLGWARKDPVLTQQARRGANHLLANLNVYKNTRNIGVGAFTGLSGIVYCFTHLSSLWREPVWLDACDGLIDTLMAAAKSDRPDFDMVDGAAGCILSLLPLYQQTKSHRVEAVIVEFAHKLAASAIPQAKGVAWPTSMAERPLLGLSHGASGIAMALARFSAVLDNDEYLETVKQALAYETHCYSAKHCNWPDYRVPDINGAPQYLSAWAHGAAGIGWSRLDIKRSLPELGDSFDPDIAAALNTTLHYGLGQGHSLCQGDLGNLGFIVDVARQQSSDALNEQVQAHLQRILDEIQNGGAQTAVPYFLKTPGLMQGYYGIAYQIHYLAGCQKLPRLLLLEGPML